MHALLVLVALSYFSAAQGTYRHDHKEMLQSVPDIHSYEKTVYPAATIHELGEYSEGHHIPETIKIYKTYEVKVPVPYPVKVPHKVPYPVAYKVPQIVKVPHIVKIAHPVPVEVVKHVPVPQQHGGDEGQSQGQGYGIQQQSGYGGGHAEGQAEGQSGGYGGSQAEGQSGGYSYASGQQGDWQAISANYAAAYAAPQSNFGGNAHGGEQSNSIGDYQQQSQYSTIDHNAYQVDQSGSSEGEQKEEGGDYSAQASQQQGQQQSQQQGQSGSGFEQQQSYQVAEMHETSQAQ